MMLSLRIARIGISRTNFSLRVSSSLKAQEAKIQKPLLRYKTLQRLYMGILARRLCITHLKGYELWYQLISRWVEFVSSV